MISPRPHPRHDSTFDPFDHQPGLADPAYARFAWRRFRRVLAWIALAAAFSAAGCWWWIDRVYGPLGWVASAALLGGAFLTILMSGALMGLAFLSSGTGHDEAVKDIDTE